MAEIKIVQATKDNFNEIFDLTVKFSEFNAQTSGNRDEFFYEDWEADFKEEIAKALEGNEAKYFLVYVDDSLAGYLLSCVCSPCSKYEIEELFVLPEFRSFGLGKKLLETAIEDGKKYNMPIKLEVFEWNKNALDFYTNMGFKSDGLVLKLDD